MQNGNSFILTSAGKEVEYYKNNYGYSSPGIQFYTPSLDVGDFTVYRMVRNNQRIYTPDAAEVQNALNYGYQREGSVATNDVQANVGNLPVYRIRTPAGIFLYTTSRIERDTAVLYYDCTAEGISFYSLACSTVPLYSATNQANGYRVYASNTTEYNDAATYYSYIREGVSWYSY